MNALSCLLYKVRPDIIFISAFSPWTKKFMTKALLNGVKPKVRKDSLKRVIIFALHNPHQDNKKIGRWWLLLLKATKITLKLKVAVATFFLQPNRPKNCRWQLLFLIAANTLWHQNNLNLKMATVSFFFNVHPDNLKNWRWRLLVLLLANTRWHQDNPKIVDGDS